MLSTSAFAGAANFHGWYGGLNIGDVNHHADNTDLDYYNNGATVSLKSFGGTIGAQVGHNWQSGMIVYGLEACANYIAADETLTTEDGEYIYAHDPDWMFTLLGRAGIASDDTLIYVAAGGALLNSNNFWDDTDSSPEYFAAGDDFEFGLVYGFGVEHAVDAKSSIKIEVLHGNFGEATIPVVEDEDYRFRFDNETTIVRAAYNWKL